MTPWSPGMSFEAVLSSAPASYIRARLGDSLCSLLELIDGGTTSESRLRTVATTAIDPEQLLANPDSREEFLSFLPPDKLVELAHRLGLEDGSDAASFLETLKWSAEQRRAVLEFLGLIVDRTPPPMTAFHGNSEPSYGLFPHQRAAAQRVHKLLYDGPRRVVLHLPTGVGKTRTAMDLICNHLRHHEPTLVVWAARGRELLEQAANEFERAWATLGNRTVSVVRMWGNTPADLDAITDGIVILGLEKAVSTAKNVPGFLDQLASRCSLTTFDEAHQVIAPTYQRVVDSLTIRPEASLLGLTATPGRTWSDIDKDEQLADFFFRQKVMLEIEGHSNPVTALIEQGYLAQPEFRTVASDSGLRLSNEDRKQLASAFEIPPQIIARVADDEQWNLQVVRTILELTQQHRRILVFAASVAHCRLAAAVLSSLGLDAEYVTGESSTRHRDQVISRFKGSSPRPMVLCNYGVLTTGFDAPTASATVIARPTKSLVLYSQMVGRVIRGPKAGGTPSCEIVTVIDPELPGFGDVAEAFINWEDIWENA